ncbi:uncharacterized protein [Pyxicephalus adspersus]|uniref:uncharacterized protein n=1 Tax=Pyxicephalus adspersus TaxID=30357 RepID=UPI003B5C257A
MEYMSGGDLMELTERVAPFEEDFLRFYAAEILYGMQYLHIKGIVHRDIKPESILLDSAGNIKIADFGLAALKVFGSTRITGRVGSLIFIAAEVCADIPYNAVADYFSFGVLLYLMATAQYPFLSRDGDAAATVDAICYSKVRFPRSMSRELQDFISRVALVSHPVSDKP